MKIIAIIAAIVIGFLVSLIIGIIGVSMNWPNIGPVFSVAAMGAFILYVIMRKDK